MSKMWGNYRQFSPERTMVAIREEVMDNYSFHELDEKMEELDELEDFSEREFEEWLSVQGWDDWWHILQTEDRPDLKALWSELWRPFIEGVQS